MNMHQALSWVDNDHVAIHLPEEDCAMAAGWICSHWGRVETAWVGRPCCCQHQQGGGVPLTATRHELEVSSVPGQRAMILPKHHKKH